MEFHHFFQYPLFVVFLFVLCFVSLCVFPRSGNSSMPVFSTGGGPFVKLNTASNGSLILTPRWVPKSVLEQVAHGLVR